MDASSEGQNISHDRKITPRNCRLATECWRWPWRGSQHPTVDNKCAIGLHTDFLTHYSLCRYCFYHKKHLLRTRIKFMWLLHQLFYQQAATNRKFRQLIFVKVQSFVPLHYTRILEKKCLQYAINSYNLLIPCNTNVAKHIDLIIRCPTIPLRQNTDFSLAKIPAPV